MRAVGETIGPEDSMLVRLDRDWLIEFHFLYQNAIKENSGGADTGLAATDPAHRGPGKGKRGARARRSTCGRGPFAPASVQIAVSPFAAVGNRGIFFLEAPSRHGYVEGVHHDV